MCACAADCIGGVPIPVVKVVSDLELGFWLWLCRWAVPTTLTACPLHQRMCQVEPQLSLPKFWTPVQAFCSRSNPSIISSRCVMMQAHRWSSSFSYPNRLSFYLWQAYAFFPVDSSPPLMSSKLRTDRVSVPQLLMTNNAIWIIWN